MKNIAFIYDTYYYINYDHYHYIMGGSETFVSQVSDCITNDNEICIDIICNNFNYNNEKENLHYYNVNNFEKLLNEKQYDMIILFRRVDLLDVIKTCNYTNSKIFIELTDLGVVYNNNEIIGDIEFNKFIKNYEFVDGLILLSEFHKSLYKNSIIPTYVIGLQYLEEYFDNMDFSEKENAMLWSSRPERGFYVARDYILPKVREVIPDFKMYSTSYLNYDCGDVEGLIGGGNCNKYWLYDRMRRCKVWWYPSIYPETFCITCLENIMCENNIISPLRGAEGDILGNYKHFVQMDSVISEHFLDDIMRDGFNLNYNTKMFDDFIKESVDKIVDVCLNYDSDKYRNQRRILKERCVKNYTTKIISDNLLGLL